MKRIHIMTIGMLAQMFYFFGKFHDLEAARDDYEEMLFAVKEAGFDGVDVTSLEKNILGIHWIREQLEKKGLSVGSYIYFDQFALPDQSETERMTKIREAVDAAKELSASVLMLAPMAHEGMEKESRETIHKNLISAWKPAAAYAVSNGLHPVIEDTPDLRFHLCRAADVQSVLAAAPGLELVYDSGNTLLVGEDPVEYAGKFRGNIGYVHLKDIRTLEPGTESREYMSDGTPVEGAPIGTGLVDISGVISCLREMGYDNDMTVEFVRHPEKSYPESLRESYERAASQIHQEQA